MNEKPHVHGIVIRRRWKKNYGEETGAWLVEYGDTRERFAFSWQKPYNWPTEKQRRIVRRAIRKAVLRHDRASAEIDREFAFREDMTRVGGFTKPEKGWDSGVWASDYFKEEQGV